jgi:dephospho-CoA kinase
MTTSTSPLKYAIALSGGIASGKSTALIIFKEQGFECIDADKIAHQLLNQNTDYVIKHWGEDFVHDDGSVNRPKLGQLIFNNPSEKKALEDFLHPLIRSEIYHQAEKLEQKKKRYFIDIPLFFETNQYNIPQSVLIYAPQSIQKKRLMARSQLSEKDAINRLQNQMDIEEKKTKATFVIDNSGSTETLEKNCKLFLKAIKF